MLRLISSPCHRGGLLGESKWPSGSTVTHSHNLVGRISDKAHIAAGMNLLVKWRIQTFRMGHLREGDTTLPELGSFKGFESTCSCLNFSYPFKWFITPLNSLQQTLCVRVMMSLSQRVDGVVIFFVDKGRSWQPGNKKWWWHGRETVVPFRFYN